MPQRAIIFEDGEELTITRRKIRDRVIGRPKIYARFHIIDLPDFGDSRLLAGDHVRLMHRAMALDAMFVYRGNDGAECVFYSEDTD